MGPESIQAEVYTRTAMIHNELRVAAYNSKLGSETAGVPRRDEPLEGEIT